MGLRDGVKLLCSAGVTAAEFNRACEQLATMLKKRSPSAPPTLREQLDAPMLRWREEERRQRTPEEILVKDHGWHPLSVQTLRGQVMCLKIAWREFLKSVVDALFAGTGRG